MTGDSLQDALQAFHARVARSVPVGKLLARWDRLVEIRVLSPVRRSFFLRSHAGALGEPTALATGCPDVVIASQEHVLRGIFTGEVNPARAHLDGLLEAEGSQRDQLVLDSIVLLVWGY